MEHQASLEIDMEERKVTRLLEVKLQPAELGTLGMEAGNLSGQLSLAEREFDAIKKEHSSKIKGIDNLLQAALDKLNKKTESREVECVEKRFFATNTLQVWHEDEMVEERAMTIEERQMSFGETQNGVVLDPEEMDETADRDMTDSERQEDIQDVIKSEQVRKNKPSLVDMSS